MLSNCPRTVTKICKIGTSVDAFVAHTCIRVILHYMDGIRIEVQGSIYIPLSKGTD